jgi:hypothetical protein
LVKNSWLRGLLLNGPDGKSIALSTTREAAGFINITLLKELDHDGSSTGSIRHTERSALYMWWGMWLQQYSIIELLMMGLESQADVCLVMGSKQSVALCFGGKNISGSAQPAIQFGLGDSARQVLSVHRKLAKS